METFNLVCQMIGSIGFPIVMCLLMYDRMDKTDKRHSEDIAKMTEAVNNNTIALNELSNRIDRNV